MIEIADTEISPSAIESVVNVLRSGMLAQGPVVRSLEEALSEYVGAQHCIAVANGTLSLELALTCALPPGSRVAVPAVSFIASANAVIRSGHVPVFVDICPETFLIDMDELSRRRAEFDAILPVHLFGAAADIDRLESFKLPIVHDSAQALGAQIHGKQIMANGLHCVSLYATKNLMCGEGGLVFTDDDSLADNLRIYRNQGMKAKYEYVSAGSNFRMTDVLASIALEQVKSYSVTLDVRERNSKVLAERLAPLSVRMQKIPSSHRSAWHQFTVVLPEETDRSTLIQRMRDDGVAAGIYYPEALSKIAHLEQYAPVSCPHAESFTHHCVSLPIHPRLSIEQVEMVANVFARALESSTL